MMQRYFEIDENVWVIDSKWNLRRAVIFDHRWVEENDNHPVYYRVADEFGKLIENKHFHFSEVFKIVDDAINYLRDQYPGAMALLSFEMLSDFDAILANEALEKVLKDLNV